MEHNASLSDEKDLRVEDALLQKAVGYTWTETTREYKVVQGEDGEDSPELKEWKKGQKVYHDDFGYGYVKESSLKSGEVVINVVFETGASKVFIPKYQGSVLVKIDE